MFAQPTLRVSFQRMSQGAGGWRRTVAYRDMFPETSTSSGALMAPPTHAASSSSAGGGSKLALDPNYNPDDDFSSAVDSPLEKCLKQVQELLAANKYLKIQNIKLTTSNILPHL